MSHHLTAANLVPDRPLGEITAENFVPKPLRIGPYVLESPAVQAALSGYSDWPMRVIARRLGAAYTMCEVMLDRFVADLKAGRKGQRYLKVTEEEHPVGGQLMGSEPDQFTIAAKRLVSAGFDVIDINFGCPVKKVLGRCRGGYHLSQPEAALEIVGRVRDAVPGNRPVTVKMRRGMDDSPESRENFYRIFDGAFELGVAAITVHGRTVRQRYEGSSSWEFLRELKRHAGDRVVLGSGDLFTAGDCMAMLQETGVDGVSVARGAIGNPWIFTQVRDLIAGRPARIPGVLEQRGVLVEHYRLARELYGDGRAQSQMRKFGIKYSRLHPDFEQVRLAFAAAGGASDWNGVLDEWYCADRPGVPRTELPGCRVAQTA